MIKTFMETCTKNADKTAFIYGSHRKTFRELWQDVCKTVQLFRQKEIGRGEKVLLFVLPSYEFYVLLFACIYYGINVVLPDSFKEAGLEKILAKENVNFAFCNRFTSHLKFIFKRKLHFIDISRYKNYPAEETEPNLKGESIVLTTFTSGTTGFPKTIERSSEFLKKQIQTVSQNIAHRQTDVVYGGLPVYVLYIVYSGLTCVLSRKIDERYFRSHGVNCILTSIEKALKVKERLDFIERLYMGGAILYKKQAEKISDTFPNADCTYVYGASEGVLIGKTRLKNYLNHFAFDEKIDGMAVSVTEKDKNGVGKIAVSGQAVVGTGYFVTSDLGYIDGNGLHIVGRARYSVAGLYNYIEDEKIRAKNPKVKRAFFFVFENKKYVAYEGRLTYQEEGVIYLKYRKLPMDPKHRTKLNYRAVIKNLV